jgi:hypothetical protein
MHNRIDDLLLAVLLLSLALTTGLDHFVAESPLTQFVTGLLTGLTIVGGIVYVYRIATQYGQRR